LSAVGWIKNNAGGKTQEVGKKLSNEFGIYDMSGNVREWCFDFVGPSGRHVRGGSWAGNVGRAAVADRVNDESPGHGDGNLGFRLVRSSGN
ncbi:MAG: SUMF1/EgtB/PvdO family nonheme iron enzyme, partial [Verrucomicrobia bacterium]|nr:SUMF1/EgtB/PvdO family nonheme iron enzyme [Verrucomicrobiota bacterium]